MTENQQLSVEAYFCFIFLLYICYLHIYTIYPKRVIISSTHSQLYPFNNNNSNITKLQRRSWHSPCPLWHTAPWPGWNFRWSKSFFWRNFLTWKCATSCNQKSSGALRGDSLKHSRDFKGICIVIAQARNLLLFNFCAFPKIMQTIGTVCFHSNKEVALYAYTHSFMEKYANNDKKRIYLDRQ